MAHPVIVTDSTADIPEELVNKYDIHVVPLRLMFGEETFEDGVDISAEVFYKRLVQSEKLPTTSQASPADYIEAYQNLMNMFPDSPIISFHISSGLSGTYQSALLAKSMLDDPPSIHVVDSKSASYGFGLLVVHAARLAAEGKTAAEILDAVEQVRRQRKLYFLVDTLEYLQKGGRIGKAAAVIGNLLNIKPILSIDEEGIIYAVEKVRGRKKAISRMIERFQADLGGIRNINVAVGHTADPASADPVLEELSRHYNLGEVVLTNIGPVVGTHVGPGTLAVFIWPN